MLTQHYLNQLTYKIIGCAIEVHRELGPGPLESVYEKCFTEELKSTNLQFISQQKVPVLYKGKMIDAELRLDVLVEDIIIVELKAVEELHPIFTAQILSYMKLLKKPKGILINFNCTNIFKEGQKTFVNDFYSELKEK